MSDELHPFTTRPGSVLPWSVDSTHSSTILNTNRKPFVLIWIINNKKKFNYVQLFVQIWVCLCSNTVLGSSSCTLSRRATRSERVSTTAASRSKASWGGRQTDALMSVWMFVYDLNVHLQKPEALAIILFLSFFFFFSLVQGLLCNNSSPDIQLGRLKGLRNNVETVSHSVNARQSAPAGDDKRGTWLFRWRQGFLELVLLLRTLEAFLSF